MNNKIITYKKQGDGRDSWRIDIFNGQELVSSEMVYEDPNIIKPNWIGLKQSLFHSSLFQRAVAEHETINQTILSALTTTLSDGANGNAKEATILLLINQLGMVFSDSEKAELNGYFSSNNFTIRL